jgi:hypothetical protein
MRMVTIFAKPSLATPEERAGPIKGRRFAN